MRSGLLTGLRVLNLSHQMAGLSCALHLADQGAELVTVEAGLDATGQMRKGLAPTCAGQDRAADPTLRLDRGETRLELDLSLEAGRDRFCALAATAHVIIEDFRPGVMDRLNLSHASLAAQNPGLVYAAIHTGEALRDPDSASVDRQSGDQVGQDRTAPDAGAPLTGAIMAFGIITALREAEATGKGRRVDLTPDSLRTATCRLQFGGDPQCSGARPATPREETAPLQESAPPRAMDADTKRALRDAFGRFATGVTVVTTRQPDGTPRGFTANSFSSVSLDPPLLLVCIGKAALSCDSFAQAKHFAVNILADDQKDISGLFASRSAEKFDIARWHLDAQDMPAIDGALARFSCARHRLVDAGDHLILIGRVLDFATREGEPLGYYRGGYFDIGLDRALADAAAAGHVGVGAVLKNRDRVLLASDTDGAITVPVAPVTDNSVAGMIADLGRKGLTPDLAHLYAVYEISKSGARRIIYHGSVCGDAPPGMQYFDANALPLARVTDSAERAMLRRYAQENAHGSYGFYHGTEAQGVVHMVDGHRVYNV